MEGSSWLHLRSNQEIFSLIDRVETRLGLLKAPGTSAFSYNAQQTPTYINKFLAKWGPRNKRSSLSPAKTCSLTKRARSVMQVPQALRLACEESQEVLEETVKLGLTLSHNSEHEDLVLQQLLTLDSPQINNKLSIEHVHTAYQHIVSALYRKIKGLQTRGHDSASSLAERNSLLETENSQLKEMVQSLQLQLETFHDSVSQDFNISLLKTKLAIEREEKHQLQCRLTDCQRKLRNKTGLIESFKQQTQQQGSVKCLDPVN